MGAPKGNKNNPNIVAQGKPFGSEGAADASAAAKKNIKDNGTRTQIRGALRRLMAFEVDFTKPFSASEIAKAFGKEGVKLNMAQACALRKVQQAMENGKFMDTLIDHVDGKQVQVTAEAKITLEELVAASYDPKVLGTDPESVEESEEDDAGVHQSSP